MTRIEIHLKDEYINLMKKCALILCLILKALDVITFQPLGSREKQPLIITSIKSDVDASKNTWFQDLECLWLLQ
jgi:hypothetical protein